MKTYKELLEAKKMKAADIIKIFKNTDEWGEDMKDQVYVKKGNLVYIDSYFYGADKAMKTIKTNWSKGGHYYDYFEKEYGIKFKIVNTFEELNAKGRHKKLTSDGIVGVELKIQ